VVGCVCVWLWGGAVFYGLWMIDGGLYIGGIEWWDVEFVTGSSGSGNQKRPPSVSPFPDAPRIPFRFFCPRWNKTPP
jgi:hypothetical protein